MSLHALIAGIAAEHANERGAALAYRGHARSLGQAPEAAQVRAIEAEEWHHREVLGELLAELGGARSWWREPVMAAIGWSIGVGCYVGGWLLPMWGAGLIERSNISAYRRLVRLAEEAGRGDLVATLAWLGQVEVEHAVYFLGQVSSHRVGRWLPRWVREVSEGELGAFGGYGARSGPPGPTRPPPPR